MKSILRQLPSFLGPGLLLFLLVIQVAAAFGGFRGSESGLLRLLEVPGVLLGWGGVALLLPLLLWMVLDWWGYTPSGFALKSLGAMSLGVAVAAVAGLIGGHAGGGVVGAALAELLGDTLGTPLAAALLVAMAAPAAVLAFSRLGVQHLRAVASTPAPASPRVAGAGAGGSFSFSDALSGVGEWARKAASLLPRRRARAASDLEALARTSAARQPTATPPGASSGRPTQFVGARDVGEIRYADEPEPTPADEEDEEALPSIADVLSGKYSDEIALESDPVYEDVARPDYETADAEPEDAEATDEEEDDGPLHVDADGNIVRRQPIKPVRSSVVRETRDESPDREVTHIGEAGPPASLRVRGDSEDESLPPGVRWADEPAPEPEPAPPQPEAGDEAPAQEDKPTTPPPAPVSPQPTLRKQTSDEDVGVPQDLPRAEPLVLDALRGTTAQRAARRQAARRPGEARAEERQVVRTDLKDTLTELAQAGPTDSHLKKLEATGLFDLDAPKRESAPADRGVAGQLKPVSPVTPEATVPQDDPVEPEALSPTARAEAARRAAQKALVHQLRGDDRDPQFADAVELALQRGAVSLVLLSRRLRTSYARSRALLDRLVQTDVVTRANQHGSHRTLLTPEFWAEVQAQSGE